MGGRQNFKVVHIFIVFAAYLIFESDSSVLQNRFLEAIFNPCNCKCGVPNREARLVGGEYLTAHEFPWAAAIQVQGANVSLASTLITPKYLLTSASNVIGKTPLDIKITVGQFDRCSPDVTSINVSVDRILIHPDYAPSSRAHDIALIRLSTPVRMDKRILPICLPSPAVDYTGKVGTLYGWSNNGNVTCRSKKLGLPILNRGECLQGYRDSEYITYDKGCTGVLGSLNPVCKNDSGAPVMYKSKHGIYDLVGILGDKNDCGGEEASNGEQSVALFANVIDHLNWILANAVDSCFCKKNPFVPQWPLKSFLDHIQGSNY